MNVEDVFSSKLRMKILKMLIHLGELNVSEIARKMGVNYKSTSKHLELLEREGLVQHKMFGRIRLFRINEGSPRVKAVQNLIATWEQTNKQ